MRTLRVALLCEESAGVRVLTAVARGPHELVAVVTSETNGGVWSVAERLGHAPLPATRIREPGFAAQLADLDVDILLNVHSLHIIPEPVLGVPRLGAYNLHPGPLPRYAGLNAPSWAICRGETEHGVTVHRMEAGIDTGDIVYQETFPIVADDTGLSVSLECVRLGVPLVERLLETASTDPGRIPRRPQDLRRREYFGKEVPRNGSIPWCEPGHVVHDFVRAFDYYPFPSPWGTPWSQAGEVIVGIGKVTRTGEAAGDAPGTLRRTKGGLQVACADEWLSVYRLYANGARTDPGAILSTVARLEP